MTSFFAALSLSFGPVNAQTDEDTFCIVQSDPLSNPIQGRSYGDPHINTFDELHYSFQTVGEFVLTKAQAGSFEVQTRQQPVASFNNLSLNSAVAMRVCGHRVAVYAQDVPDNSSTVIWLDGIPTPLTNTTPLPGGGEVQRLSDREYAVLWPSGDQVLVRFIDVGNERFLNIMPTLSRTHSGTLTGLLGNFNGNSGDDLMSREGSVVPPESSYSIATAALDRALPAVIPVREVEDAYFDTLYRQFGDSWRITQTESLFDYGPGQSTETFTDRSFPREFVTLNAVAPARIEAALDTCQNAGVEEALLDGCVFDVAATGEPDFATAAANAIARAAVRELTDRVIDEVTDDIPNIPIPGLPF
ncbi:MAG: VWD domain-containing protein [Cyanobacteria bacterium J06626_18]